MGETEGAPGALQEQRPYFSREAINNLKKVVKARGVFSRLVGFFRKPREPELNISRDGAEALKSLVGSNADLLKTVTKLSEGGRVGKKAKQRLARHLMPPPRESSDDSEE